jgi:hypothetical protein
MATAESYAQGSADETTQEHAQEDRYAPKDEYAPENGCASDDGYAPEGGFPREDEYASDDGYAPEDSPASYEGLTREEYFENIRLQTVSDLKASAMKTIAAPEIPFVSFCDATIEAYRGYPKVWIALQQTLPYAERALRMHRSYMQMVEDGREWCENRSQDGYQTMKEQR